MQGLILTATLAPFTGQSTESLRGRVGEYASALGSWRRAAPETFMVLIDNSGDSAVEALRDRYGSPSCVITQVAPATGPLSRGKGYFEAAMVLEAMAQLPADVTRVAKVTGRLFVPNYESCLGALPRGQFVQAKLTHDLTFSDSRFFAADTTTFRTLAEDVAANADDSRLRYFEHELARAVLRAVHGGAQYHPFARQPRFVGYSAESGERYDGLLPRLRGVAHDVYRYPQRRLHLSI